jgi:hypothetical protein
METATAPGWLAEGAEINSKYRLGSRLSTVGRQSVYETIFRGTDAVIKVVTCDSQKEAVSMMSGFILASQLPHPGLMAIYDFGQEGNHAWMVMERGEECLGEILKQRTLGEDEVRQLLEGMMPALEYLHDRQFAIARLQPSNVFACGDRIKLSADRIVAASHDSDAGQLSALILESLTGSKDAAGAGRLASPFREIVRGRWDLSRTKRALAGEIVPEALPPVLEKAPAGEPHAVVDDGGDGRPKYRKYAGLAIGGVLASACLCALLVRGARETSTAKQVPAQTVQMAAPAPVAVPEAAPLRPEIAQVPAGWAVVGASFTRQADAEKRAGEIRKAHSRIDAKVFQSNGAATRFVVVFATGLSEAQARRQLARSRRSGAPRGTYVTRFQ